MLYNHVSYFVNVLKYKYQELITQIRIRNTVMPMPISKSKKLNNTEATSIPHVAMTTWKALVDQAGLDCNTSAGKRSVGPSAE